MKTGLDVDKIAKGLGTERGGKVTAAGGYFGAIQLAADIQTRFRVLAAGANVRREIPLSARSPRLLGAMM